MNAWGFYIALALLAGSALPVQAGINGQLSKVVGHPMLASLISFCVGTLGLICLCLMLGVKPPSFQQLGQAPIWMWLGGFLGALLVSVSIFLAPKLGATTMVGLIVAGQLLCAVTLDHFGLLGYSVHTVSVPRLAGVVLLLGGMVLIQRS